MKRMNDKQINKYNTTVRCAMSDKYVECTKKKCEIGRKYNDLYSLLHSVEGKNLPYNQYLKLQKELEYYDREHHRLQIELSIWGEARDICMDIADEVF